MQPLSRFASRSLLLAMSVLFPLWLNAQTSCKVLLAAISASYEGECKSGLAQGTGTAQGLDKYTGSFKKGLPDGRGHYTWQNGNTYNGEWLKGQMNGQGTFAFKRTGKKDSVIAGTWENNVFQEDSRQAYIVHQKSAHVTDVDVKQRNGGSNTVTITLTNSNSGSTFSSTPSSGEQANWQQIPAPQLTAITVLDGFYDGMLKNKENARSTTTKLSQVKYPFRIKIEISDQNVDIELSEPSDWTVNITMDNKYNPDVTNTPIN